MYLQVELLCHWQGSELQWECDVELRGDVGSGLVCNDRQL